MSLEMRAGGLRQSVTEGVNSSGCDHLGPGCKNSKSLKGFRGLGPASLSCPSSDAHPEVS